MNDHYLQLFLQEVNEVCEKHGYVIWHEDSQGQVLITEGIDNSWFMDARYRPNVPPS